VSALGRAALDRLWIARTGQPGSPPQWDRAVEAEGADQYAQLCERIAYRASQHGADDRCARFALSSRLWKHRSEWLTANPPAFATPQIQPRHYRRSRTANASAAALALMLRELA
jgi:hypothetical protein